VVGFDVSRNCLLSNEEHGDRVVVVVNEKIGTASAMEKRQSSYPAADCQAYNKHQRTKRNPRTPSMEKVMEMQAERHSACVMLASCSFHSLSDLPLPSLLYLTSRGWGV
jgi:hypothetical protein